MLAFPFGQIRNILCLGAHSDDIEIGCGATLLHMAERCPDARVQWIVLSAAGRRAEEARASAEAFLGGFSACDIVLKDFRDGFFPYHGERIKAFFEELKQSPEPDLIFTHHDGDRHQDHRLVNELTWNTFRNHLILEYEIAKYDADLGRPNVYVPLTAALAARKVELLMRHFPSQAGKHWFDEDLFHGLMRLRAVECAAPEKRAEAFHARKLTLDGGSPREEPVE